MTDDFTCVVLPTGCRGVSATVCCAVATVDTVSTERSVEAGTVDAGSGDRSGHVHKHLPNHTVSKTTKSISLSAIYRDLRNK